MMLLLTNNPFLIEVQLWCRDLNYNIIKIKKALFQINLD